MVFAFLLIPVTLLLVFQYLPALKLVQLSLSRWNGYSSRVTYVGLENYLDVVTTSEYYSVFFHNLAYIAASIVMVVASLYLAIILNTGMRARSVLRTVFFLPYVLNGVAIALMFNFIFDYNASPVNVVLRWLGLDGIRFIVNDYRVNLSLAGVVVWRHFGFYMVLFLAGLQSIPNELYDAAEIDGASFFQVSLRISLPGIVRVVEVSLFLSIVTALRVFYEPYLITRGGPAGNSHTFVSKIISVAFEFSNFGKASAMGVVLLVIMMIVVSLQRWAFGRGRRL